MRLRRKLHGLSVNATAGATAREYGPAALGGHAGAETVGALALQDAGLERSFHLNSRFEYCAGGVVTGAVYFWIASWQSRVTASVPIAWQKGRAV